MALIESLFVKVFVLFYLSLFPLFKNPVFTTYVIILLIFCGFAWLNFKWIKKNKGLKKQGKAKWKYFGAIALEVYLIAFLLWYVFYYFQTYRINPVR